MCLISDFCFPISGFQSAAQEGFSTGAWRPACTISGLAELGVARLLVSVIAFVVDEE